MFRGFIQPGELPRGPPPFGHPHHVPPPGPRYGGTFGAPPDVPPHAHLPTGSCRPFLPHGLGSEYLQRPMREHYINPPHCSNFSIDRSTVISLGSQQILPPDTQHLQMPQWPVNPLELRQRDESENLTAGEEFLRCLAANKPIPDFLKGVHLSDTGKAGVSEDRGYERQRLRSNSRSPAKESRGRSKSRAKSLVRSKSRARSKSCPRSRSRTRGKSRARSKSRPRSRSHSPGKSQVRSKTKARSRSRSRGKSQTRSKCRARSRSHSHGKSQRRPDHHSEHRDKRSPSRSCSGSSISSHASASVHNDLLQGLKRVMNSKQLEDSMPSIKNAILTIQANNFNRELQSRREVQSSSLPVGPVSAGRQEVFQVPDEPKPNSQQEVCQMKQEDTDSNLLPHERVGSDFSWLQGTRDVSPVKKPMEVEDEEDFLYGNEDNQAKQSSDTQHFAQSITQQSSAENSSAGVPFYQSKNLFGNHGETQELKTLPQLVQSSSRPEQRLQPGPSPDVKASPAPTAKECEKIKNMLKNIGLNMGTTEISNMMVKLQQQKEGKMPEEKNEETQPALAHPLVLVSQEPKVDSPGVGAAPIRQALESLQSIIKAKREKKAESNPNDGNQSQRNSDKQKNKDDKESQKSRQDHMKRKETLLRELAELLKQDGSTFLIPVIGFYCQKCEEFFGDLSTAESHSAAHRRNEPSMQKYGDRRPGEDRGHPRLHQSRHPLPLDWRDQRDPRDLRHLEYHRDLRHPDLERKQDEGPKGYRNDREKMYVKEERPESPRFTNVLGHTPPGLHKGRGRAEEGRVEKGYGAAFSAPASGTHGRVKLEEVETRIKPTGEGCDKMDKDEDNRGSSSSSDEEKGKSPKGHKKKKKKEKKKKKKKEKDGKKKKEKDEKIKDKDDKTS